MKLDSSPTPTTTLTWVTIRNGAIALTGRPKKRALRTFAAEGATHVLTLLSEREEAPQIGEACEEAGLGWIWFPLQNGQPLPKARDSEVSSLLSDLRRVLDAGGRLVVHCSAGIHRTGMITFALLRVSGLDPIGARETLRALRDATGEGVGDHRVAWAEEFLLRSRGKRREVDAGEDDED